MQPPGYIDQYPLRFVLGSTLLSLSIYAIGVFIIYQVGLIWLLLYLLYIIILEVRLLGNSCINCYYYGKTCAFGKGRLSCLLFKKGDPHKFSQKTITWVDILPDFLVFIVPMLVGIALLIGNFSLSLLILVIALLILGGPGNGMVRGQLACKYCKQREIGCPAEHLFGGNRKGR